MYIKSENYQDVLANAVYLNPITDSYIKKILLILWYFGDTLVKYFHSNEKLFAKFLERFWKAIPKLNFQSLEGSGKWGKY